MTTVLTFLRSLGPSGAVANAAVLLDERRHEERIVQSVVHHLGGREPMLVASRTAA
jgi:hypothetical protein